VNIKLIVLPLALILVLTLILSPAPSLDASSLFDKVIRLHVVADSDLPEAQALKLRVRDALLPLTSELLRDVQSKAQAEQRLRAACDRIGALAEQTLEQAGCPQSVRITLDTEHYPARTYANFSLPGGEYTSLRVEIGAGKGENWWCVLYPSLCLSASAADAESAFLAAGFTPEQIRLLQGGSPRPFRIRFRLIEWLTELFS